MRSLLRCWRPYSGRRILTDPYLAALARLGEPAHGGVFLGSSSMGHVPGGMSIATGSWGHVPGGVFIGTSSWGHVHRGVFLGLVRGWFVGRVRREGEGFSRPGEGPGEAWRGSQSVILEVASCGVGGLFHNDGSSRTRIWEVANSLAWFVLAAGLLSP